MEVVLLEETFPHLLQSKHRILFHRDNKNNSNNIYFATDYKIKSIQIINNMRAGGHSVQYQIRVWETKVQITPLPWKHGKIFLFHSSRGRFPPFSTFYGKASSSFRKFLADHHIPLHSLFPISNYPNLPFLNLIYRQSSLIPRDTTRKDRPVLLPTITHSRQYTDLLGFRHNLTTHYHNLFIMCICIWRFMCVSVRENIGSANKWIEC